MDYLCYECGAIDLREIAAIIKDENGRTVVLKGNPMTIAMEETNILEEFSKWVKANHVK